MGSGSYSVSNRSLRATTLGYDHKSTYEIFDSRNINNAMNPAHIQIRESRDSAEHPNSLAILLALDETGSMGSIPHFLVKEGLPKIMGNIIQKGIKDPQLLFVGVGDHTIDNAPLQVGQFESSDELLDKWLTSLYLEGGGGGNDGESYMLAWYFAGYHTSIDCFEKRHQKGFLFTIGDEKVLHEIPGQSLKKLMVDGEYKDVFLSSELLEKARERYIVKHLHLMQGHNGQRDDVINDWKQFMGDDLIIIDKKEDIATIIVNEIIKNTKISSLKTNKIQDVITQEEIIL